MPNQAADWRIAQWLHVAKTSAITISHFPTRLCMPIEDGIEDLREGKKVTGPPAETW